MNLNHFAGLKLIRKIRRSRLLCLRQVRAGEAEPSAYNDDSRGPDGHGENVIPVPGTSNHVRFRSSLDWAQQNENASRLPPLPLLEERIGGEGFREQLWLPLNQLIRARVDLSREKNTFH